MRRDVERTRSRDVVGEVDRAHSQAIQVQGAHVNGPGSPGELFVEGERFNIQRFYADQARLRPSFMGRYLHSGRRVRSVQRSQSDHGHDSQPYSGPRHSPNGMTSSYPLPDLASKCRTGRASDRDKPPKRPAILGQLVNNPANRYAPPGYWFYPTQPNGVGPFQRSRSTGCHRRHREARELESMQSKYASANAAAINQLRATSKNPITPYTRPRS